MLCSFLFFKFSAQTFFLELTRLSIPRKLSKFLEGTLAITLSFAQIAEQCAFHVASINFEFLPVGKTFQAITST